jgi:hypothetical protein
VVWEDGGGNPASYPIMLFILKLQDLVVLIIGVQGRIIGGFSAADTIDGDGIISTFSVTDAQVCNAISVGRDGVVLVV